MSTTLHASTFESNNGLNTCRSLAVGFADESHDDAVDAAAHRAAELADAAHAAERCDAADRIGAGPLPAAVVAVPAVACRCGVARRAAAAGYWIVSPRTGYMLTLPASAAEHLPPTIRRRLERSTGTAPFTPGELSAVLAVAAANPEPVAFRPVRPARSVRRVAR